MSDSHFNRLAAASERREWQRRAWEATPEGRRQKAIGHAHVAFQQNIGRILQAEAAIREFGKPEQIDGPEFVAWSTLLRERYENQLETIARTYNVNVEALIIGVNKLESK